jgi:hypothetical protein
MRIGRRAAMLSALAAAAVLQVPSALAEGREQFRIMHHQALEQPAMEAISEATGQRRLDFQAAGRQWSLLLRPNPRMAAHARDSRAEVMEGYLPDREGSWVRLTQVGGELWGMVHDGHELWIIEPTAAIEAFTGPVGRTGKTGNSIFRMADTLIDSAAMSCGTVTGITDAPSSMLRGDMAMAVLGGELGSIARAAGDVFALAPLSVVGDRRFTERFGGNATEQLLVRMNNADGIYREQLGIGFELREVRLLTVDPPQLEASEPDELLRGFARYRSSDSLLLNTALSHLLTGRRFTSSDADRRETLGIAFVSEGDGQGVLCNRSVGSLGSPAAALTSVRQANVVLDTLVISHEIGHNFGAVHDGDAPCAEEPASGFIMAASINSNIELFSQCSVGTMLPFAERALASACLLEPPGAQLALTLPASSLNVGLNAEFGLVVNLANPGGAIARGVQLETTLPASVTLISADTGGAACTFESPRIICEPGDLEVDAGISIEHRLRATATGTHDISILANAEQLAPASATVRVTATAPTPAPQQPASGSGGGGGGGGSIGLVVLLAVCLAWTTALRRRHPRPVISR